MGGIQGTSGKGSARFVQPIRARAVLRWTDAELEKMRAAVADRLNLDETCALFPHRSRDSVRDQYYRARSGTSVTPINSRLKNKRLQRERSIPEDQKDAIEGSAKLLEALMALARERKVG